MMNNENAISPAQHFADRIVRRCAATSSRLIVGLDPDLSQFPQCLQRQVLAQHDLLAETIVEFNRTLIDSTAPFAVGFKPQSAFYEQYGAAGLEALQKTLEYLRANDLPIIFDGKRNDVGHTASAYAHAWLAERQLFIDTPNAWHVDAITLNGYLGEDSISPFLNVSKTAGVFILAKTSNPSAKDLQDISLYDEQLGVRTVFEHIGTLVAKWGQQEIGESGYSRVGLVVGATYPDAVRRLRKIAPSALFLMPGIGAQEGSLEAAKLASDDRGYGFLVVSARSVMYAFDAIQGESMEKWQLAVATASAHEAQAIQARLKVFTDRSSI